MRTLMRWLLFPVTLFGAVVSTVSLVRMDFDPGWSVIGVILLSAVPMLLLEGWMPAREDWRRRLARSGVDVVHMASTALATQLFRALTFGAMLMIAGWIAKLSNGSIWPNHWPIGFQLAMALAIGDFGAYWVHRAAHAGPLWRIHAMHHTSDKLSTLSAGRNHPLNTIASYSASVLPLLVLGADVEVLTVLSVFTAVHGMLQHANVDLRHGPLNYVFTTAEVHRWHHSSQMAESNTNFSSNIALWDHVFGTYALREPQGPERAGLSDVAMPDNYWVHLATPFTLKKWVTGDQQTISPEASGG